MNSFSIMKLSRLIENCPEKIPRENGILKRGGEKNTKNVEKSIKTGKYIMLGISWDLN